MIQQTSVAIYNQIKEQGLLGRLQFEVYDVLYTHGPMTQNELHREHFSNTQPRNIQPRVSELEARGVVKCVGERSCRITGHVCMVWGVTNELPREPEKRGARKILTELLSRVGELERTIKDLKEARFDGSGQGSLFGNTTYKGH